MQAREKKKKKQSRRCVSPGPEKRMREKHPGDKDLLGLTLHLTSQCLPPLLSPSLPLTISSLPPRHHLPFLSSSSPLPPTYPASRSSQQWWWHHSCPPQWLSLSVLSLCRCRPCRWFVVRSTLRAGARNSGGGCWSASLSGRPHSSTSILVSTFSKIMKEPKKQQLTNGPRDVV